MRTTIIYCPLITYNTTREYLTLLVRVIYVRSHLIMMHRISPLLSKHISYLQELLIVIFLLGLFIIIFLKDIIYIKVSIRFQLFIQVVIIEKRLGSEDSPVKHCIFKVISFLQVSLSLVFLLDLWSFIDSFPIFMIF